MKGVCNRHFSLFINSILKKFHKLFRHRHTRDKYIFRLELVRDKFQLSALSKSKTKQETHAHTRIDESVSISRANAYRHF